MPRREENRHEVPVSVIGQTALANATLTCTPERLTLAWSVPEYPEYDSNDEFENDVGRCLGLASQETVDALMVPVLGEEYGDVVSPVLVAAVGVASLDIEADDDPATPGEFPIRATFDNETTQGVLSLGDRGVSAIALAFQDTHLTGSMDFRFEYGPRRSR